ncbi:exodeoxyribonuclease VIII [Salmonella enterica]|nr:exodeoxyribonuclease VIII [Salmonella enterica]EAQ9760819.1 exodeoxyribonuclease VIII [Salmonella enterica]EAS1320131.1 exodeoxyribonuclease VIII [Salmonella enterica]EBB1921328.1 exodeoxyribonuclease VIII [Salmonella enterica]EBC2172717.1 exodeoxyribonuclease VIII [Salmonella enterica]
MSIKQEEYSFYYKVKNESARKRLGFKAGFFWCTAKKQSLALSRGELAMDAAGFDEADFARPVRVHFPVENDIPPEGVFDTKFCENREPGGEDGKTLTLIPGAASAVKSDETERADGAGTPAGENGIQESHNPPANPQLTVVATLPFRHRVLAQYIGDGEYLYHVDTDQKKEIACLEMDTQNTTVQNLILAAENVEPFKKAIEHDIHEAVNAYKQVSPVDGKVPELCTTIKFFKEWFRAEHINRGLLVKEWAERLKNKPAPVKKTGPHKVIVDDVNKPERPRRSEKPTHRTINYELACGFCEELDLNNLRPAMDFAKRIIAEDREDWKRMSMTVGIIPDIKGYDRQTIIDLVRKAPKAVHNGNPDLRRMWCESFLAVHGVRDPDWYEYVPDNTPTTHEENAARLRQAGKCLRDIEAGRFQCDEEKQQPTGELADEPATPEAVEQDTTEHHPDPQPLENESPVSQTEAGYQKIRAELHEARKNIPPKNPVDVGKQLAAARGEYVEGISDPNDPKWVHNNYSASNQGEKEEVVPEEKQPAAEPEAVTRNADGTFDVSALFSAPSNQIEKMEARTEIDGEMRKESNQRETAGDAVQEITADGGSGTGGDEAGEAADSIENGNITVPDDIQPGIYYDIPNEAYHAGPGVSKSQLDDIADTPAIYLWRKNAPVDTEKTKSLDTGTAFHCRVLEPEEFSKRFIIAPEFNRRTSAGKEEEKTFQEECARTGRTVLTAEEGRKIELMYQSVMALPLGQWLVESAGYAESSVYWEDPETGILCRCRPDKIIPEFHWIMDVKTTADIQRFRTAYYDYRYHVQDAFYSDGYRAQFGEIPTFVFLVASTTTECGRYPVEIFMMGEEAKLAGQREYRRNLQTLAECLNNDEWPAIKTLSLPRWAKENANA